MAEIDYDISQYVKPERRILPPGQYLAQIVHTERQRTRSGEWCLLTVFEIVGGTYRGHKVYVRHNLWHTKEDAREASRRAFASLCQAAGLAKITDSEELHSRMVYIHVEHRQGENGPMENVKKYSPCESRGASRPIDTQARRTAEQPAQPATAPGQNDGDIPF